ncbi:hypothetical protein EVAR_5244_1 [Eumeta japonica]|uniref:Helitron helicase-like domain-containing protein n=2 Tax=Eumeta variegata TaxID=151549 RepID=A0A4C1XNN8_EUMVA|nr:hypothetical protein EVAR_5244_1 [Eumeta japonica]
MQYIAMTLQHVFRQKLKSLISFITKSHVFGPTRCWMYSVEWQKRGLPHAHILVWFIDKIRPEEIDSIISAEIPDPSTDQLLFDIVTTNMIHGPCDFTNDTVTNVDGYPIYRRRNPENGGQSFIKNIINTDIDIDNRWVVPYSPLLSKTYNAHINVEFCSSVKSIKYICKYVHKGSDMAVFRVENTNVNAPPVNKNDEITLYQIGRYISSNEAAWRIFGFPIHERDPAVVQLAIHLENGQRVFFTNETAIDRAINPPKTTLTAFFELCNRADDFGAFARTLLYSQVPRYFTWTQTKHGCPKQGSPVAACLNLFKSNALGRLFTVNPRHTECFYLRLLLVNVTGPLSFQDIRKVNGQQYPTYKDACLALGLLEDDNQWECMLAEAALNCTAIQIRLLFAIVLTTCFPARAQILWENHKDSMTDDILHQHRIRCHDLTITFSDEMYNEALIAIEDLCIVIANLPLSNFGMNSPNRTASDLMNTEMNRELQYSTVEMAAIVARNVPLMNEEQRTIYDRIMLAVSAGQAKINMRVQMLQDPSAETFSKQLLDIGDGKVAIDETGYRTLELSPLIILAIPTRRRRTLEAAGPRMKYVPNVSRRGKVFHCRRRRPPKRNTVSNTTLYVTRFYANFIREIRSDGKRSREVLSRRRQADFPGIREIRRTARPRLLREIFEYRLLNMTRGFIISARADGSSRRPTTRLNPTTTRRSAEITYRNAAYGHEVAISVFVFSSASENSCGQLFLHLSTPSPLDPAPSNILFLTLFNIVYARRSDRLAQHSPESDPRFKCRFRNLIRQLFYGVASSQGVTMVICERIPKYTATTTEPAPLFSRHDALPDIIRWELISGKVPCTLEPPVLSRSVVVCESVGLWGIEAKFFIRDLDQRLRDPLVGNPRSGCYQFQTLYVAI